METLESLSARIDTTREIRGIVRTMKALSAVSIHQYERATEALAVYRETVDLGFMALLRRPGLGLPTAATPEAGTGIIVFGSDRGLCGRFNERVAARVRDELASVGPAPLLVVGTRMAALLEADGVAAEEIFFLPGSAAGLTRTAQSILVCADRWRRSGGIGRIVVHHNRRVRGAAAEPVAQTLLPIPPAHLADLAARPWPARPIPDFRMAPRELFSWLVREHLLVSLIEAGAQSLASEHAARLAAMKAAERNIEELLDGLSAGYRRMRQDAITAEILDIVTGVEAMRRRGQAGSGDEART